MEIHVRSAVNFSWTVKNRCPPLFIVHARGGMWNHRGKEETKAEWWGEMDRGEDRDLLSSGVFDGSHDRLYNKSLMGNDSKRKRDGKKRGRTEGGAHFHSDAFGRTGVMFGRDRDNKIVCHLEPQTHNSTDENHSLRLAEMIWTVRFFDGKVKADTFYNSTSPCGFRQISVWFVSSLLSSMSPIRAVDSDAIQTSLIGNTNNWQHNQYENWQKMFLHKRNLVTFLSFATCNTFTDNLPASQQSWKCFSAEPYLCVSVRTIQNPSNPYDT